MSSFKSGPTFVTSGLVTTIDTTLTNAVGTRACGIDAVGNAAEFIYLYGCASTIAGSVVTYDELGATALIVANAKGPVAVAMSANTAVTAGGWYCIQGTVLVDMVANTADNACLGRETTDGKVGDGKLSGDEIGNMFSRGGGTTAAALQYAQLDHPFVDDFLGA